VPGRHEVVVGAPDELLSDVLEVEHARWLRPPPSSSFDASVRIRHRAGLAEASIARTPEGGFRARFAVPQRAITPGQAAVVYRGDEVLGGGLIVRPTRA
jgi:tRNA-specific 2-thiouridylase